MQKKFKQMSHTDRIRMEALLNAGHSKDEVAKLLGFHRSTIYREYNKGKYTHRNTDYTEKKNTVVIWDSKHGNVTRVLREEI